MRTEVAPIVAATIPRSDGGSGGPKVASSRLAYPLPSSTGSQLRCRVSPKGSWMGRSPFERSSALQSPATKSESAGAQAGSWSPRRTAVRGRTFQDVAEAPLRLDIARCLSRSPVEVGAHPDSQIRNDFERSEREDHGG